MKEKQKKKKLKKNKIEKEFTFKLATFMEKHNQTATFIAEEIKRIEKVKFSSHTIYRWLANKQTITLKNWDYLNNHIERYEQS